MEEYLPSILANLTLEYIPLTDLLNVGIIPSPRSLVQIVRASFPNINLDPATWTPEYLNMVLEDFVEYG